MLKETNIYSCIININKKKIESLTNSGKVYEVFVDSSFGNRLNDYIYLQSKIFLI